jgi:hypothetical protein
MTTKLGALQGWVQEDFDSLQVHVLDTPPARVWSSGTESMQPAGNSLQVFGVCHNIVRGKTQNVILYKNIAVKDQHQAVRDQYIKPHSLTLLECVLA